MKCALPIRWVNANPHGTNRPDLRNLHLYSTPAYSFRDHNKWERTPAQQLRHSRASDCCLPMYPSRRPTTAMTSLFLHPVRTNPSQRRVPLKASIPASMNKEESTENMRVGGARVFSLSRAQPRVLILEWGSKRGCPPSSGDFLNQV